MQEREKSAQPKVKILPKQEKETSRSEISIKDFELALSEVHAGLLMEDDMELPEGCTSWAKCEWLLATQKKRIARVSVFAYLDWEGGFLIELEYIVQFVTGKGVTKEQLEEACGEIFILVWNDASFVATFLTDRFVGFPVCMPPEVQIVEFSEAEETEDEQDNDG